MSKQSLSVMILSSSIALVLLVGLSSHRPRIATGRESQVVEAAFRDGLFQAKLDIQSGRQPHFMSGRWSNDKDRALFIAGYEQGYRELAQADSLATSNLAELEGYRDGMLDGAAHRLASQRFQVDKTENYRAAGQGHLTRKVNPEEYKRYYRRAYSNGYQRGYYSQQVQEELKTVSETMNHF